MEHSTNFNQEAKTTYFVFSYSGQVLLEDNLIENELTSYILAFGKNFAKVDGIAGESTEITYFHYDNLGSTRLMTDMQGEKVFEQDYLPFGGNLPQPGHLAVYNQLEMKYKFTGQMADTGATSGGGGSDEIDFDKLYDDIPSSISTINDNNTNLVPPYNLNHTWNNESPFYHTVPDLANIDSSLYDEKMSEEELINILKEYLSNKEIKLIFKIIKKLPNNEQIHVLGVGYGGSGGKLVGIQDDMLLVFDDKGNIGFMNSFNGGVHIGQGFTSGERVLFSRTANVIYDLPGPGVSSSGEFGWKGRTTSYGIGVSFSGEFTHTFGFNKGKKNLF